MERIFSFLMQVTDERQQHKVVHTLADILMIVFFAHLAKCDSWEEIAYFSHRYEASLRLVLPLDNGIPSKDTIRRVMSIIQPSVLKEVQQLWNELLVESNRKTTGKFTAIDGKTMRGNHEATLLPLHIVTAYNVENGLSIGQTAVVEKSKEITTIPTLLAALNLKGHTVTIDAMGTQQMIAEKIKKQKADYVLAVKGNQPLLYQEIKEYLDDPSFEKQLKATPLCYTKTIESAHSQVETREYYQTTTIDWMNEKNDWFGLRSIGKVVTSIEKEAKQTVETRYYISSCPLNIQHFQQAVRGHWGIESMHWHLDVTFGEDGNHTLNKTAA